MDKGLTTCQGEFLRKKLNALNSVGTGKYPKVILTGNGFFIGRDAEAQSGHLEEIRRNALIVGNGNGICQDGYLGNGKCICYSGYYGLSCEKECPGGINNICFGNSAGYNNLANNNSQDSYRMINMPNSFQSCGGLGYLYQENVFKPGFNDISNY